MLPILAAVLPAVAPYLLRQFAGERAAGVAEQAAAAIEAVTGTADPAEALARVSADPAALRDLQVRLAEIAAAREADRERALLDAARIAAADTADARATGAARAGALAYVPAMLTLLLFAMLAAVTAGLFTLRAELVPSVRDVLLVVVGVVVSEFRAATAYWLGTSRGAVEMRQAMQRGGARS